MKTTLSFSFLFFFVIFSVQEKRDYTEIIHTIIENEDFNKYLHFELENRRTLYVFFPAIKDEFVINYKSNKIILVRDKEGIKEDNYLKVIRFKICEDKVIFSIFYPIENIEFNGTLSKKAEKWIFQDQHLYEL